MGYTKNDIHKALEIASKTPHTLYQQAFINYRGDTTDTREPYTEVISEWLLANIDVLSAIKTIDRKPSYRIKGHDGVHQGDSNRGEELIAMNMFRFCTDGGRYDHIGKIIDYQTPLKGKRNDKAGKVDLLAWDGNVLRILELKEPDSTETMLRCVLEGYTYLKTVNTNRLLKDFGLPAHIEVVACPFVFKSGGQYDEYYSERPMLKALMGALNSKPYFIDDKNPYQIVEG